MSYPTVFDLIACEFKKAGIEHVLVGGFAVNAHHVTRQTMDVDLMIAVDDLEKASAALSAAGYRKGPENSVVTRFKGDGKLLLDIDLILVEPSTFHKILSRGQEVSIAGRFFKVPSLEHLIAMKFHALKNDPENRTPKDLLDIIHLVRRNGMDPQGVPFRKLCETYGASGLFEKIQFLSKGPL